MSNTEQIKEAVSNGLKNHKESLEEATDNQYASGVASEHGAWVGTFAALVFLTRDFGGSGAGSGTGSGRGDSSGISCSSTMSSVAID